MIMKINGGEGYFYRMMGGGDFSLASKPAPPPPAVNYEKTLQMTCQ